MEKTYKRVPFDIELAKKIQSGEVEGRIVTDKGWPVRIVCFDVHNTHPILALIKVEDSENEDIYSFKEDGFPYCNASAFLLVIELLDETPKYEFKPFDKVLARDTNCEEWRPDIFCFMAYDGQLYSCFRSDWYYCIPYEGNEHLLGTTDKPKEE